MVSVPEFHNDVQYASEPVECQGVLEVVGNQGEYAILECQECHEDVAVKRPVDTSWQDRRDLQ